MSKKWLHHFDVRKDVKKEVKKTTKNDKGEEVTTTTTVTEREPFAFALQKPTRRLYEDSELFFAVKLSEGIKAGLLTRPLLAKRYKNDGGAMSEPEKERYAEVYYQMLIKQEELEKLKLNLEDRPEDERARKASRLMADIVELQEEIQQFESTQSSLFDQTAENRAKNMTIMWWVLHLAHKKENDDYSEVFGDGGYEDRLEVYDDIEDKNEAFWTEVVKKFAYFTTFWYLNGLTDEKEFKQVENMYNQDLGIPTASEEEELASAEEEAKAEEKAEEKVQEEAKAKEKAQEEAKAKEKAQEEAKAKEEAQEEAKAKEEAQEEAKAKELVAEEAPVAGERLNEERKEQSHGYPAEPKGPEGTAGSPKKRKPRKSKKNSGRSPQGEVQESLKNE